MRSWILALLSVLVLSGCASVEDAKPPTVRLTNIELKSAGILSQELRIEVRIGNPNDFDLPLTGMTFQLDVNGRELANGLSNDTVTVPRLSQANVALTGTTNTFSLLRQLLTLGESDRLAYRLHGIAYVGRLGINKSVPYDRQGELSLLSGLQGGGGSGGLKTLVPISH